MEIIKTGESTEPEIRDEEFTEEETGNQIRLFEGDILKGMLAAAQFQKEETQEIIVARGGVDYFAFHIRPLTEEEYEKCRSKHTKYVRNKQLGIKMPEDTNSVKYRSELIYCATTEADRKKTWDNRQLWSALEQKTGKDILTGTDVIDLVLMPGEKAAIVDKIDLLSGYNGDFEEVAKN